MGNDLWYASERIRRTLRVHHPDYSAACRELSKIWAQVRNGGISTPDKLKTSLLQFQERFSVSSNSAGKEADKIIQYAMNIEQADSSNIRPLVVEQTITAISNLTTEKMLNCLLAKPKSSTDFKEGTGAIEAFNSFLSVKSLPFRSKVGFKTLEMHLHYIVQLWNQA